MASALLDIRAVTKHFRVRGTDDQLVALDDVSLGVARGSTLALIGESGSGKTTLARCIAGLTRPTSGSVWLSGAQLWTGGARDTRRTYRQIQMVYQDPRLSLNPRMTVAQTLAEPLARHLGLRAVERAARVRTLVDLVGLSEQHLRRKPHELSGGQRQRVGIARAIAVEPSLVVLDEPTASLDVSVRGTILDLLRELQERLAMTYLFISHDLEAVQYIADDVAIMYLGAIVEQGPAASVLDAPQHPYTRALMSAAPRREYGRPVQRFRLTGEIPSPIGGRDGCRLVERCPLAQDKCHVITPHLARTVAAHHTAACLFTTPTNA